MSKSKVFFTDLRTNPKSNLTDKLEKLVKRAGIEDIEFKDKFVAVKIHFGEPGNLAYLRPNYAAKLTDFIASKGASVFLTDCNTLYHGGRRNAVDHIKSAMTNGYNPIAVRSAPVIIADGLKGTDERELPVPNGEYCKTARIGAAVAEADIVISMSHFKGHEQSGFGGTLKNLGMGAASVAGKLFLHSDSKPAISAEDCVSCGICVKHCAFKAISLNEDKKAVIDYDKCAGCGQCVALCRYDAAALASWDTSMNLNAKIAEYTCAILNEKPNFHINFIMNVSPECDCWNHNDAAIIPDLGIAASFDPVALDQACADLVTAAPILKNSAIAEKANDCECGSCNDHNYVGDDKFRIIHPDTDWAAGLNHAQKLGIGKREYELVKI